MDIGTNPKAPKTWKTSPRALPTTLSPIDVSGASSLYRGERGEANPLHTHPPLPSSFTISHLLPFCIPRLAHDPTSYHQSCSNASDIHNTFSSTPSVWPLHPHLPPSFCGGLATQLHSNCFSTSEYWCFGRQVPTPYMAGCESIW